MSRSRSCAEDVHEDGRVLGNENGECESPALIDLVLYWKIGLDLHIYKCCKYVGRDLR